MIATSGFIRRKATDAGRRLHYAPALGPLAQLVEQGTLNPKVAGSIPARPIAKRSSMRSAHGPVEGVWGNREVPPAALAHVRSAYLRRPHAKYAMGAAPSELISVT